MWEQLSLAAFLQRHWADNQVSCTVTFDPDVEGPQLEHALEAFQYQLKGVSFLPRAEEGAYEQMPYESIDEDTYHAMVSRLHELQLTDIQDADPALPDKFCDSTECDIRHRPAARVPAPPPLWGVDSTDMLPPGGDDVDGGDAPAEAAVDPVPLDPLPFRLPERFMGAGDK